MPVPGARLRLGRFADEAQGPPCRGPRVDRPHVPHRRVRRRGALVPPVPAPRRHGGGRVHGVCPGEHRAGPHFKCTLWSEAAAPVDADDNGRGQLRGARRAEAGGADMAVRAGGVHGCGPPDSDRQSPPSSHPLLVRPASCVIKSDPMRYAVLFHFKY